MAQFEIGEGVYRSRRMPAMTEMHVTRRLAPVINGMIPQIVKGAARTGGGLISLAATDTDMASKMAAEFVNFVASMPDADANFVISECCIVTERKQGETWAPIWTRGAQGPQFQDIRMPVMIQIVFSVVKEAVADFMPSLGLSLSAGGPDSASTMSVSQTITTG